MESLLGNLTCISKKEFAALVTLYINEVMLACPGCSQTIRGGVGE